MNYELRPPRRGLPPNLPSDLVNEIARLEYAVFTKAEPALVWKIFSDLSLWPKFFPLYSKITWLGAPWTQGSRLRLEVRPPVSAVMDRVLTLCTPPHHVAWINHVRGYTMEQWVSIEPYQGGGSRISTWIEITGKDLSEPMGKEADMQLLRQMVVTSFDSLCRECDLVAAKGLSDNPRAAD
jgi:hypothetical protein